MDYGVTVLLIQMDVGEPEEIKDLIAKLPEDFKDLDVLVKNAVWSKLSHRDPIWSPNISISCSQPIEQA